MDTLDSVLDYVKKGSGGVLATVITRTGSAPRQTGSKMFIGDDGRCYGTVGGGRLESDAHNAALSIMGTGQVKVLAVRMDGSAVEDNSMLCGGNVDILLEPVLKGQKAMYAEIVNLARSGKRGITITMFGGNVFRKTLMGDHGIICGDPLDEKSVETFMPYLSKWEPVLLDGVFIEPVLTSTLLYIFGAGHVSQCLSHIAHIAGFEVTVVDTREEFANGERFPDATRIIVDDFARAIEALTFTGNEFVAIITNSHQSDAAVLGEILKHAVKYMGMIGSARKIKTIFDHLRENGHDGNRLNEVRAPIGIKIGAETPQEIAVSIVAELIAKRREH